MYMCEFNSFYNVVNTAYNGRTGWLNCSKLFDPNSNKFFTGSGCYNHLDAEFPDSENYDYEIFIPQIISRSSSAIYFKIGLPINSENNISRVIYNLPPTL